MYPSGSSPKQKEKLKRIARLKKFLKENKRVLKSDLEQFAKGLGVSVETFNEYLEDMKTLRRIQIVRDTPFRTPQMIIWKGEK